MFSFLSYLLEETSWTIVDACPNGKGVIASGSGYTERKENLRVDIVADPGRYRFSILDAGGDGICCGHGDGMYEVNMLPCEGNTPGWVDMEGDGCDWYEENDTPVSGAHIWPVP